MEFALGVCDFAYSPKLGRSPFLTTELPGRARGLFMAGFARAFRERRTSMRTTGTVKYYNTAKGYGFVAPADGSKDVFVHASALEAAGIPALNEGDKISFVLEDGDPGRGKKAAQIELA
jgi:CspA family cold shock protein